MIKILSKDHREIFNKALDFYCANTDHEKSGYYTEDRIKWVELHKDLFISDISDDYVVVGDIQDNFIFGMAIGYRSGIILGDKKYAKLIPSWHLAFTWKHEKYWASPKKFIFDITNPISLHMENKGIFDFTKIMRVNLNNLERIGIDAYINRTYNKNIPDGRYNAYAESIVSNIDDLQTLPKIMQKIYPENILAPLMCVRHVLKNEIRNKYLLSHESEN
jgi:hypothetical protein